MGVPGMETTPEKVAPENNEILNLTL